MSNDVQLRDGVIDTKGIFLLKNVFISNDFYFLKEDRIINKTANSGKKYVYKWTRYRTASIIMYVMS